MKQNNGILRGVPLWLWVLIVFLLLVILAMPMILVQPGKIDFSETGQIGDTIGGIMGPLIAILAAFLTFIAFWVQYEANVKQREDIAIERHEAKYYKMLDIYSSMTTGLEVHGIRGKEAFAELVGEFTYTFFTIDGIYKKRICSPAYLSNATTQIKAIVDEFQTDKVERDQYLISLAYNLFFYGSHFVVIDTKRPERTALGEEIKKIAFSINRNNGKGTFLEYVKAGNFEVAFPNLGLSVLLYEGHSDFLGHYFRHLFQMVKYVSLLDRSLFDEEDKSGYVKLLRAQMSDYEQILLYYNSLTDQGAAWNKTRGDKFPEEAGYISRFRLIKNLPPNFPLFGILPFDYYKEDANKWEKLGKKFYEHLHLPISKRALDL